MVGLPGISAEDALAHYLQGNGEPISISTNWMMTSGGGRFVTLQDFPRFAEAMQETLGVNGFIHIVNTDEPNARDPAFIASRSQYLTGIGSGDWAERGFIYGGTSFRLLEFTITSDAEGKKTISAIIKPFDDNFDFDPQNSGFDPRAMAVEAEKSYLRGVLDPNDIGVQYPIQYEGEYHITLTEDQYLEILDVEQTRRFVDVAIASYPTTALMSYTTYRNQLERLLPGRIKPQCFHADTWVATGENT